MELTQCINYLLTTAQHKVFQEMSSRLEKFDVTPVQYAACEEWVLCKPLQFAI